MSARGQQVLIAHLTDADSLDTLAREGLDEEIVPTEALRDVVAFALDYYHRSGRTKAPSEAAIRADYGDLLDDHEMVLGDPEDSIEWALDDLKGTFVQKEGQRHMRALAADLAEATTNEKAEVFSEYASEAVSLSLRLERRDRAQDMREGMGGRLLAYEQRALNRGQIIGMSLGLPEIDEHTGGIHPGELAVVGGGAKTGKSYLLAEVAKECWKKEDPTVLFTLENSVEMTIDRIACLAMAVDPRDWQRGTCHEDDVRRIRDWQAHVEKSDTPLWILQPAPGKRTAEHMVREAQLRGAKNLLIDQLTFMEHPDPRNKPRHEVIRDITHTLKTMISSDRNRLSCLLAHQIKREGITAAAKRGYLLMTDFAEGSEVERTADWAFGLYQSNEARAINRMLFQMLAARRETLQHWMLDWQLSSGNIRVRHPHEIEY